mgnify:CR=1 FL=1
MSLKRVDLNLFRVFEVVMQHRSVSAASKELGVTPSAISHALSRLRNALGDELFVYGDSGMEPTARAFELAPSIRDGLGRLDDAMSATPFDPAESTRSFRIAATDFTTISVLTGLVSRLVRIAPQVDLRIFPCNRMDVVRHLDDGRLDLVISWFQDLPDRVNRATIMTEKEAVVVRPGHPLTEGVVTKERLFAFPYIVVELTGSEDQAVDGFVDDRGIWRRVWVERLLIETDAEEEDAAAHVAVTLPHYAAIPHMLRATDMVATLPGRLARDAAAQGAVVILDLPYEPLCVPVEAIWHQRADRDPGLQWLLGELIDVMRDA